MRRFSIALLWLLGAGIAGAAVTVTDDAGSSLTLTQPAQRVVSLSPHITDMLLAQGARRQLVGVMDDHPQLGIHPRSLTGLPVVADAGSINEERLLALQPDLVLVWSSGLPAPRLQRLRALGLRVVEIDPKHLDGIADDVRLLGQLSGHEATAQAQATQLRQTLAGLHQRYGAGRRLRGFYQVWLQPLYSVRGDHLISQALALCGVDSILPAGGPAAPMIDAEYVLEANPDVIVFDTSGAAASRAFWQRFPALSAVRAGHLLVFNTHDLERPGPGMIGATAQLCAAVAAWR